MSPSSSMPNSELSSGDTLRVLENTLPSRMIMKSAPVFLFISPKNWRSRGYSAIMTSLMPPGLSIGATAAMLNWAFPWVLPSMSEVVRIPRSPFRMSPFFPSSRVHSRYRRMLIRSFLRESSRYMSTERPTLVSASSSESFVTSAIN